MPKLYRVMVSMELGELRWSPGDVVKPTDFAKGVIDRLTARGAVVLIEEKPANG